MKCTKLHIIGGKRITVAYCKIGLLVAAITVFVIVERIYGPF